MVFTGYYDKNSKKIHIGDKVKSDGIEYQVVREPEGAYLYDKSLGIYELLSEVLNDGGEVEVIE